MIKLQTKQTELATFNNAKGHMIFDIVKDWAKMIGETLYVYDTATREVFTCRHIVGNRYEWKCEGQDISSSTARIILDTWCA